MSSEEPEGKALSLRSVDGDLDNEVEEEERKSPKNPGDVALPVHERWALKAAAKKVLDESGVAPDRRSWVVDRAVESSAVLPDPSDPESVGAWLDEDSKAREASKAEGE